MATGSIGVRRDLDDRGGRSPRTQFRTSVTSPEGLGDTDIFMGRIINVDLKNWTVDIYSQFDNMRLLEIPVASPYTHANRGEGIYVVPEVNAKCAVCWPGDSSPPFVVGFVNPHETTEVGSSEDAPAGTRERADVDKAPTDVNYGGGRPKAKPGDIIMRGRDGNFVVLHRGGVLQIGSTELAQRVYVPLRNLVMDFAENYEFHGSGGSIKWGIQEGRGDSSLPTEYAQTYRVFANDEFADIRVALGRVRAPVPERDPQLITDIQQLGIGTSEPIVCEFTLARGGFKEDGSPRTQASSLVALRFAFDRAGNSLLRVDGNVAINLNKRLRLRVGEEIEVFGEKSAVIRIEKDLRIEVGGTFEITCGVLKLNNGDKPVARVGDPVQVALPPTLLSVSPTPPGFAPVGPGLNSAIGTITSGKSSVLG